MDPVLSPTSLIAALRAERHQPPPKESLQAPPSGLKHALVELSQDIRAGGRNGFRAILEGCLATDNPRGAAAAFIDKLMPPQAARHDGLIESDGEHIGYYRTPPLETLQVSNALQLSSNDTIVDVGGGNGTTAAIFALLNPAASVVCLEFQECLALQAVALKERFQLHNLSILPGDAFTENLSFATILYMYYPFSDRLFSRFLDKFEPKALPDFVLNGNCPERLSNKFNLLIKSPVPFTNPDISWWKGNLRT